MNCLTCLWLQQFRSHLKSGRDEKRVFEAEITLNVEKPAHDDCSLCADHCPMFALSDPEDEAFKPNVLTSIRWLVTTVRTSNLL